MELTHDFTVPADVDTTWATFMDLESVGNCFPGAQVTEFSDEGFSGTVKVKLGPIALQYAGSGAFIERDDASHHAVIEAKGKDKRGNGTAGATVQIELAAHPGGTQVHVVTDLSVTGKPAQFGRGVMQDVSDKLLQQFVTCIEGRFAAPEPEPEPDSGSEAAAEPGSAPDAATSSESGAAPETPASNEAPVTPVAAPHLAPAAHRPAVTPRSHTASADDAIDLGATVLPVLLRTYAPYAVAALAGVVLGYVLGRRRS